MHGDLQQFVRDALGRGLPRASIREVLSQAGWRAEEIEAALRAYAESDFPVPVPRRRPSVSAREAFLYLVLFAALYTSAFNTGQVLFAIIERWLPDPLGRTSDLGRLGDWVRAATAGTVITFPIFLLLSRAIGREVEREPEKRGSPVRRWLTYLTLFVAAVVIIGDLTTLVTHVLGGELAVRFLLKALVVALIAGTAFAHYLGDLRREEQGVGMIRSSARPLPRLAAAGVLAVIVVGLILSGAPREERARQLDAQRIEALQRLQLTVQGYHGTRHRLPESLEALLHVPDGVSSEDLVDPATGRSIEYRMLDSLAYELCAEFQTASVEGPRGLRRTRGMGGSDFWRHGPGRTCFRFEVAARR